MAVSHGCLREQRRVGRKTQGSEGDPTSPAGAEGPTCRLGRRDFHHTGRKGAREQACAPCLLTLLLGVMIAETFGE